MTKMTSEKTLSENLAKRMLDIGWAHTVAYVPREALSGAAIAALGCDEILMGQHARMGDAGPISKKYDKKRSTKHVLM